MSSINTRPVPGNPSVTSQTAEMQRPIDSGKKIASNLYGDPVRGEALENHLLKAQSGTKEAFNFVGKNNRNIAETFNYLK